MRRNERRPGGFAAGARVLLLGGAAALAACADQPAALDDRSPPPLADAQTIHDEVVGVSLAVSREWRVTRDPVLFDDSYGFLVSGEDADPASDGPHDREPVARIARVYPVAADRLEDLVRARMEENAELRPTRSEVEVGEGLRGVAVTGLPGVKPYSVVYVAAGKRLYEIGLWTDEPGLDARARMLLASLRFTAPTRSVESLDLRREQESLHWEPEGATALRSRAERAERRRRAMEDVEAGLLRVGPHTIDALPVAETTPSGTAAATCGMLAPYGTQFQWQTQWDGSNVFYGSGPGYRGWTRMSGNGGSWWGEGFHVWACRTDWHNQYYANDWPAQFGANVYSHFSGYVRYAGWAKGGHYTLGRIVIVRNGQWSSLSAHLNGWGPGIYEGVWVDAPWDVIGYAGNSDGGAGYDWAPHVHSRVTWGESYNGYGMPYGGQSVKPRAFRCYACTDYDEITSDGRKWYTVFYRNRWMKY